MPAKPGSGSVVANLGRSSCNQRGPEGNFFGVSAGTRSPGPASGNDPRNYLKVARPRAVNLHFVVKAVGREGGNGLLPLDGEPGPFHLRRDVPRRVHLIWVREGEAGERAGEPNTDLRAQGLEGPPRLPSSRTEEGVPLRPPRPLLPKAPNAEARPPSAPGGTAPGPSDSPRSPGARRPPPPPGRCAALDGRFPSLGGSFRFLCRAPRFGLFGGYRRKA